VKNVVPTSIEKATLYNGSLIPKASPLVVNQSVKLKSPNSLAQDGSRYQRLEV
jgi:hypothetical protein